MDVTLASEDDREKTVLFELSFLKKKENKLYWD